MKRVLMGLTLAAVLAAPAAAQQIGMPMWNSPKGGTGLTLSADLGRPSDDLGSGTAFGARATLGLANLSVTAGFSSWEPEGAVDGFTSFGGNAAFRVIGGSLLPIAVNLQAGAARNSEVGFIPAMTRVTAGVGVSASVPTPGLSIEPYLSLTNRWYTASGFSSTSNFGWTLGANVNFGMFGAHLAFDSEDGNTLLGIGGHVSLKAPIGL